MISAVDTNIFLDILIPGAQLAISSKKLLDEANERGAIIINEIVYSELSSQFDSKLNIDKFLSDVGIKVVQTNSQALWLAAEKWRAYRARRIAHIECPKCGDIQNVICAKCGFQITQRQRIISDFIIGAHASLQADLLLTRDRGFYKTYFQLTLKP